MVGSSPVSSAVQTWDFGVGFPRWGTPGRDLPAAACPDLGFVGRVTDGVEHPLSGGFPLGCPRPGGGISGGRGMPEALIGLVDTAFRQVQAEKVLGIHRGRLAREEYPIGAAPQHARAQKSVSLGGPIGARVTNLSVTFR